MKNEEKLYNYLKELSVPTIKAGEHKKILHQKLQAEYKQFKEESSKLMFRSYFKYAFTFSVILIVSFGVYFSKAFILDVFKGKKFIQSCVVTYIQGEVNLGDKNTEKNLKLGDTLSERQYIKTGESSETEIKIGDNSILRIKEKTVLNILKLYKDKEIESTKFFLDIGKILVKPKDIAEGSSFEIETRSVLASVRGTEFEVSVNKDKETMIEVFKGKVNIIPKIEIEDIKAIEKINKEFGGKIFDNIFKEIVLFEGESISISYYKLKDAELKIKSIIQSIKNDLEKNQGSPQAIKNIIEQSDDKLKKIRGIIDELFNLTESRDEEKNKPEFDIRRLPEKLNLSLNEKNTAVASGNNKIFIASDQNSTVYCINSINGKIEWTFKNKELKSITSPVILFNNNIILSTPYNIFVLNYNGDIKLTKNIEEGTNFWASSLKIGNNLYIPTSKNIYLFDGSNINLLEGFPESNGQLYISSKNNDLFFIDLNDLRLQSFDLKNKKVIWQSEKLNDRVFMPPVITKKYIVIADMKKNIYKYDNNDKNSIPTILNLGTGIMSNIIYKNNNLYFIANNGFFYELNINTFNKVKKLKKVDNTPDPSKYLTKKLLLSGNDIYFSSDTGKLFHFNLSGKNAEFIEIKENNNLPLIGSPVKIGQSIFVLNNKGDIFKITKSE